MSRIGLYFLQITRKISTLPSKTGGFLTYPLLQMQWRRRRRESENTQLSGAGLTIVSAKQP